MGTRWILLWIAVELVLGKPPRPTNFKKLKPEFRFLSGVAERLSNLKDILPPIKNKNIIHLLEEAERDIAIASDVLQFEITTEIESKPWYMTSNKKARKQELRNLRKALRNFAFKRSNRNLVKGNTLPDSLTWNKKIIPKPYNNYQDKDLVIPPLHLPELQKLAEDRDDAGESSFTKGSQTDIQKDLEQLSNAELDRLSSSRSAVVVRSPLSLLGRDMLVADIDLTQLENDRALLAALSTNNKARK